MRKWLLLMVSFLLLQGVQAQKKAVTGKVTDPSNGQPLAGVTVKERGVNNAVSTGDDGVFSIQVAENAMLEFTAVGYEPQFVRARDGMAISLKSTQQTMDEVVVVAYGTAKKESFTGAAAKIDGESIRNRPLSNVSDALAGAAPGVQASANNGQPGSAPTIRVRGFGSISASNDPLYVVDGIPTANALSNLSPDDIESMTILKDAASTALYGSRAANGVVMITTKKGRRGKSTTNVRLTRGATSRAISEYDRTNAWEYYPLMWESYRNSLAYRASNPLSLAAASQIATDGIVEDILAYNPFNVANNQVVGTDGKINANAQLIYRPEDLDWEDAITRKGARTDAGISFTGAQDKFDYFFSLGYLNEKGFLIKSDFERINGRLNVNAQVQPWLKTGLNISGTFSKGSLAQDGGSTSYINPFFFSRGMGPIYPIYAYDPANPGQYLLDGSGNRQFDLGNMSSLGLPNRPSGASGGRHTVAETEWNQELYKRNAWSARTYAEISILKDLKFTSNFGVDITNRTDNSYQNPIVGDAAPGGRSYKQSQTTYSYTLNQLLNYKKRFGNHSVDVLLGHENYDYKFDDLYGRRSTQILDGNIELVNFATVVTLASLQDNRRIESYFSRVNYDFDEKYFVSASYRTDGSSKFYKDVRWGDFWSVSAGWRIDKENFMQNVNWIDGLKLRSSYGETGNDGGISFYAWQPRFDIGYNNASEPGIIQSSLGNNQLVWESNSQFDIALEFAVLKSRITGSVEFFDRRSSNLLFDVPLPVSSGVLTQSQNVGTMYNRGVELNLGADLVRFRDFRWNINLNLTTFKNEITKMPQDEIINGTKKLKVGQSIYDYWLRDYRGVNPDNGAAIYAADKIVASNTYIDDKGDSLTYSQNNAKFHYAGSAIPDFYGSVTNSFEYKGIQLSTLITFQKGGKIYDATYASLMSSGNYGGALHVDALKRWQKPGDVTNVPRMDQGQTAAFNAQSDRWLTDASFINIRNITLAYALPQSVNKRLYVQAARFYLSAENVQMFSKRTGMNVEQTFTGVTSNVYVPARVISVGLNVTL